MHGDVYLQCGINLPHRSGDDSRVLRNIWLSNVIVVL
jgi:hypothetical protein